MEGEVFDLMGRLVRGVVGLRGISTKSMKGGTVLTSRGIQ